MFIALEADIPALVKNIASNRNEKFNNLLSEVTNDFKSDKNENFFDIFRNKVQNSDIRMVILLIMALN